MMILEKFKKNKLFINWTTILIGWNGPGKFSRILTEQEVINYALELVQTDSNVPDEVWLLAGCSKSDTQEIQNLLIKLASFECNQTNELLKWEIVLLQDVLEKIDNRSLYGLLQLTEFWEKFQYPSDSPHTVQGRNNEVSIMKYYTEETFNSLIKLHYEWIDKKLETFHRY